MNLLYCGDKKMADGLLISALSIARQTREPLHVYVLSAQLAGYKALADEDLATVRAALTAEDALSTVQLFDITNLFMAQPPRANMDTIFTPYCMLRLYADLVPELPDRLLYLDTDVISNASPRAFYRQDLTGKEVVGVLDYYGRWFFHSQWRVADYMNSGVLLLNLGLIRKDGLFARCRQMCADTKMFMPDQSALNKLAARKSIAPRRYNEQRRLHRNTVFQHFTTSFRLFPWVHTLTVKPWEVDRVHDELHLHEYDELLGEYTRLKQEN